ncbi:MAG: hypothetical protein ISN29_06930 [Gammaproteobacteria bacterium AqS3]|nr:hypothetical protein [Gammaproteobacteria bacterium AqS3]
MDRRFAEFFDPGGLPLRRLTVVDGMDVFAAGRPGFFGVMGVISEGLQNVRHYNQGGIKNVKLQKSVMQLCEKRLQ